MDRLVGEQRLSAGEGRGGLLVALALLLTDAEPIVQSAQPGASGDGIQPGELIRRHPLAPQIALGHEGELLIQGVPEGVTASRAACCLDGGSRAQSASMWASRLSTSKRVRISWILS